MAKPFDPRTVLKQLAKPLLKEFFERRGDLKHLPWDELKNGRSVEEIYAAWQQLPEDRRRQVQVVLRDLVQLSDDRGMRAFTAEILARAPDRAWEFQSCKTPMNKALWFYLNFSDAFEQASLFALADGLSTGRYVARCNNLPQEPLEVTPVRMHKLERLLHEHYWPKEMRGEKCRVSHYSRPGGTEYFFAYLDDWPDSRLVFSKEGELMSKIERYTFSVVYAACPEDGSLELIARGDDDVRRELQRRFFQAVYGLEIEPSESQRPQYRLQHVLDPNFTYPTAPTDCIRRVRLVEIRLQTPPDERGITKIRLEFHPEARRREWLAEINRILRAKGWSTSQVTVLAVKFQLIFEPAGFAARKTMTFGVRLPNWCDLKTHSDEMRVIGERCLRLWEMYYGRLE